MRVNLQYSIELEEVFKELRTLHCNKNIKNDDNLRRLIQDLERDLYNEDLERSRSTIKSLRKTLFNLDSTLADIDLMLEGYERIQEDQSSLNQKEEENEQFSEANESGEDRDVFQLD